MEPHFYFVSEPALLATGLLERLTFFRPCFVTPVPLPTECTGDLTYDEGDQVFGCRLLIHGFCLTWLWCSL